MSASYLLGFFFTPVQHPLPTRSPLRSVVFFSLKLFTTSSSPVLSIFLSWRASFLAALKLLSNPPPLFQAAFSVPLCSLSSLLTTLFFLSNPSWIFLTSFSSVASFFLSPRLFPLPLTLFVNEDLSLLHPLSLFPTFCFRFPVSQINFPRFFWPLTSLLVFFTDFAIVFHITERRVFSFPSGTVVPRSVLGRTLLCNLSNNLSRRPPFGFFCSAASFVHEAPFPFKDPSSCPFHVPNNLFFRLLSPGALSPSPRFL